MSGEKSTVDDILEVLSDPAIIYNRPRSAASARSSSFMAKTGTLKNPPADWKDMFFPEALAGS